jgi:hypothetical protein
MTGTFVMSFDPFHDLQRRVTDALQASVRLCQEKRALLRRYGRTGGRQPPDVCGWIPIHRYLTDALGALDAGFDEPEWRLVRSRLIREGTCACVHVRMRQFEPLRASLQAMSTDAMQLPITGERGGEVLRVRRLIRLALSHAVPDRVP